MRRCALGLWLAVLVTAPASTHACDAMMGVDYREPPEWLSVDLQPEEWDVAFRARAELYARKEYVRSGATLQDWQELVAWNVTFRGAKLDLSAAQEGMLSALRGECTSLESRQIEASEQQRIFEWWHDGCYERPAQHDIVRIVAGRIGVHTLSYSHKGQLVGAEREQWIQRITAAKLQQRIKMQSQLAPFDQVQFAVWRGDYAQAVERLQPLAKRGDLAAEELLARLYYEGWGVPRDPAQALRWFESAAAGQYAPAQYNLGRMYEQGLGTPLDLSKSLQWFRSAAERGDAEAQGHLGYLALNTKTPDYVGARQWLEKSAAQEHLDAFVWLGRLYEEGWGVQADAQRAADWYRRAATQAVPDAQYRLGMLYARGVGVEQSDQTAKKWLIRAVMQGNEEARAFYRAHFESQR
jgi:TPR repeat protein